MTKHDLNDIEWLIVRKLDGELSPEQSLELDRELLKNPNARVLFEEYKQIDALASAAMDDDYASISPRFNSDDLPSQLNMHRWSAHKRYGWLVAGAIAAAVMALVIPIPSLNFDQPQAPKVVQRAQPMTDLPMGVTQPVITQPSRQDGMMRYVDWREPRIQRDNGREVIGVIGDDGNFYWIEVNRLRTIRKPKQRMVPAKEWGQM